MDVTATFLPVAMDLIDGTFGIDVVYRAAGAPTYDTTTGQVTAAITELPIKAAILSRGRSEEGGVSEATTLTLWIHHGPGGLPQLPTTGDEVLYDGSTWKVSTADPTYAAAGLIASKLVLVVA